MNPDGSGLGEELTLPGRRAQTVGFVCWGGSSRLALRVEGSFLPRSQRWAVVLLVKLAPALLSVHAEALSETALETGLDSEH